MIPDALQTYLHRLQHDDVAMLLPEDIEALRKNAVHWADESDLPELASAIACYPTREAVIEALLHLADILETHLV